ncbi:MAG: hypothetical protein RIC56_11055 [Pseudomonadales bacterium]
MTHANRFRTVVILGALLGALSACEKQGPMEKAGESVDEALESSADKMEEIGDDVRDAVSDDTK